jgi:hypothetical protein
MAEAKGGADVQDMNGLEMEAYVESGGEGEEDGTWASSPASSGQHHDPLYGAMTNHRPHRAKKSKKKKSRGESLVLTDEQEKDLAEWYRHNEVLYDTRRKSFKQPQLKMQLYDEKAAQLDIGYSGAQVKAWVESMRTVVGKLTNPKKMAENHEPKTLTERETWILENFGFVEKYVMRRSSRKVSHNGADEMIRCG